MFERGDIDLGIPKEIECGWCGRRMVSSVLLESDRKPVIGVKYLECYHCHEPLFVQMEDGNYILAGSGHVIILWDVVM